MKFLFFFWSFCCSLCWFTLQFQYRSFLLISFYLCIVKNVVFFFSIIKHVCMNKLIKGQQKLMILFLKELCNINFNLTFSFTIPKWSTKNKKKWFPSNLSLLSFNYFFLDWNSFFILDVFQVIIIIRNNIKWWLKRQKYVCFFSKAYL